MKKALAMVAALVGALVAPASVAAALPSWDLTGTYTVQFDCLTGDCTGSPYIHTMNITSSDPVTGAVTGSGFVTATPTADWTLTGTVDGSTVTFDMEWSVASGLTTFNPLTLTGSVDGSGAMSGTAVDGQGRTFDWETTAGAASAIDRTPPAAMLTAPASPTKAASPAYTLTFDRSVSGLTGADFTTAGTATGCSAAPSGSGASYTVALNGCSEGTVTLTLKASSVTDGVGNLGPAANVAASSITIDRTAPGAVLTAPASPTSAASLGYTVEFTEPVTGLVAGDFTTAGTATGCTVGAPTGSGTGYTVALDNCSEGTVTLTLKASSVTDAATNLGPLADVAASTVTVDRTSATATLSCTPASGWTNATTIPCSVTFTEAPGSGSAFTATDVSVGGSTLGWTVSTPIGSGAGPYTFSVTGGGPDGTVTIQVPAGAALDGSSNPTTASNLVSLNIDRSAPTTQSLAVKPTTGAVLAGSSIPLTVTWSSGDTGGSGVARFELAKSRNGGTWTTVSTSLLAGSANVTTPSSGTVRFRVRAVDAAGNAGAWTSGATLSPRLVQDTSRSISYSRPWIKSSKAAFSGGSEKSTSVRARRATYHFTGRSIALVSTLAANRGKVKIYVNGVFQAQVNLFQLATQYRTVAWQKTFATSARRTITLVVVGTAGHPRVGLDAFVVMK